ncbi:MAG: UDP-glucose 4-epimerase GalE [Halobacteriovoraceae bacterium]|nr:UDP-glucose 4-epimerase GalE [Halobacteriovoraceae bacterium]|tara:strand:- start:1137 stop:2144 length:1008 start_codon:yes stop_codon:yes gene_type:complete
MKNSKILVTGGAGYIGSHVVKLLGEAGYDLLILDNLSTGNKDSVLFGELIVGDVADTDLLKKIFTENKISAVMNFAGSIKVPESVENPLKYYLNNTVNTTHLLRACQDYEVTNFIFSSTAAVYGLPEEDLAHEESKLDPINPYGRSKLVTEWELSDLSHAWDKFNYVALRYFNVSGADFDGKIGQAFPEPFHLINLASEAAAGKRDKLSIFGEDYETKDGTCVRDYIHVVDLAQAHVMALEYLLAGNKSTVLNCGYGEGFSVKEVIGVVKKITGVDFPVEVADRRPGDPAILVAKAEKIKKVLGWQPLHHDLEKIVESAYKWEQSETLKKWRANK